MGYIYKITDLTNYKLYIGQTHHTIEYRWNQHIKTALDDNFHSNYYLLYRAMRAHKIENFTIEEVEQCDDCLLNEKEIYWIDKYNSYYKNERGYNMTYGGCGTVRYSDSEILKLWNDGYSAINIAKLLGARNSTIGYRLQSLVGADAVLQRKADNGCKSIAQYDLDGHLLKIWRSGADAEKELNLASGSISRCCNKQRSMAGNCLWKFTTDDTSITDLMVKYAQSNQCNDVYLIEDNKFSTYFSSAKQAELELHLTRGKVSEVCNHKYGRKSVGGYKFEWAYPLKRELVKS